MLFPCINDSASLIEATEPVLVETFISEPAIEALHKTVLYRFAWLNELEFHSVLAGPFIKSMADELRTVVADDRQRIRTADSRRFVKQTNDSRRGDRRIDLHHD